MIPLKLATASQQIPIGHFVDSTDGDTAETALTIANTDVKLWKRGATSLVDKNSSGATHMSGGVYYLVLDATDTDTPGPLVVFVKVAGALACKVECIVLQANVYEALVTGVEWLEVSAQATRAEVSGADLVVYKRDDTTQQFTNPGTFTTGADVLTALAGKP